jgi:acetyl esterase
MIQKLLAWILRRYYISVNRKANPHTHTQRTHPANIPSRDDSRKIPARHYSACDEGKPLIVFFHGGGWVIGDLETHDALCAKLNQITGCAVLAIDYRLAPEHRFPAAFEDAIDATVWAAEQLDVLTDASTQLIVAGDSAGGNLAAAVSLNLPEAARASLVGQVLIYPVTEYYLSGHKSYIEKGKGYALSNTLMHYFWNTYLGEKFTDLATAESKAKTALPGTYKDLSAMPKTFLSTAENDPLRDEGVALKDALVNAGVETSYHHFGNSEHGFATTLGADPEAVRQIELINDWIAAL